MDNRTEDPERDRRKGIDRAQRALERAREDTDTAAIAATVLAYFGENIDTMAALADRAMALNPSSARGWYLSGVLRLWAGQPDQLLSASSSHYGSVRGHASVPSTMSSGWRICSSTASTKRQQHCSWRSKSIAQTRLPFVASRPVMPIWDGCRKPGKRSNG